MFSENKFYSNHLLFISFYLLFLLTGFLTYSDYGISWDEPACRSDMAIVNFNYVLHDNYASLLDNDAKYHGPAFEMFLYSVEKAMNLKNTSDIYRMRHLLNFLLFALAVLFFYLLCIKHFKTKWIASLGSVFLVLSPRIYADAFYNSKDLAFLSLVVICIYTTTLFLERRNYGTALVNALVTAIMVDIRIMGIIIPAFTGIFLLVGLIRNKETRLKTIRLSLYYFIPLAGLIILFWPILWRNPLDRFISAFIENSKFPWDGFVFYNGKNISASHLPWHYLPRWIIISTPILYLIFFSFGIFFLTRKLRFYRKPEPIVLLNMYVFLVPLLCVIFLHSVVYDGWRHLYFIYPSIIFIALTGVDQLSANFKSLQKEKMFFAGILIYSAYILITMIQMHPYENLYFNGLAGRTIGLAAEKFELDYWGLSYSEGINYILKSDTSSFIKVASSEPDPLNNNKLLLSAKESNRLITYGDYKSSDYYITSYRNKSGGIPYKPIYNVIRDDAIILSVFKMHINENELVDNNYLVAHFENSYDSFYGQWTKGNVVTDSSANDPRVESIDTGIVFSSTLFFYPDIRILNSSNSVKSLEASVMVKSQKPYEACFVFQADSGKNKTYIWNTYNFSSSEINQWNKHHLIIPLPSIYSQKDGLKFYICNTKRNNFLIDQLKVKVFSVPVSTK